MPDNLTNAEENRLLDASLPVGAGACQLRLTSDAPTDAAAGTELAGNGYAAQNFTATAAAAGTKENAADILFPAAVGADWAEIQGYEVWVGAERRWYRALAVAERRTVRIGDVYRVAAGILDFSLS